MADIKALHNLNVEYANLNTKIKNLEKFFKKDEILDVPKEQIDIMREQHTHMMSYADCLKRRIELLMEA